MSDVDLRKAVRDGDVERIVGLYARMEAWEMLRLTMIKNKMGFYWHTPDDQVPYPCECGSNAWECMIYKRGCDINIPGNLTRCNDCGTFRIFIFKAKNLREHLLRNYPASDATFVIEDHDGVGSIAQHILANLPASQAAQMLRQYASARNPRISSWQAYKRGQRLRDDFRITRTLIEKASGRPKITYHDHQLGIDIERR